MSPQPPGDKPEKNMTLLRLADDVHITLSGSDGFIIRSGRTTLTLPGEGARLRRLSSLLQTPRPEIQLRQALAALTPQPPQATDLVDRLIDEGVLVRSDLGSRLAELHQRTTLASEWPAASPALETSRLLRESGGENARPLPPPALIEASLSQVLVSRRTAQRFVDQPMTTIDLATILALAAGSGAEPLNQPAEPLVLGGPPARRTYPSGGALYPVEILVYPWRVAGLESGFYYYQTLSHRLVPVAPVQPPQTLVSLLNDHPVEEAALFLCLFVDFARPSLGKYGEKSYRLALLEAGHIAQNVLLVAAGLGLGGLPLCGFYDQELSLAAGLLFPYEAIIYVLALGYPAAARY
jgi:SagB-type dehydrogenase family enzyme